MMNVQSLSLDVIMASHTLESMVLNYVHGSSVDDALECGVDSVALSLNTG